MFFFWGGGHVGLGKNSADPDQGLHCLLFNFHVFDKIPSGLASLFEF